MAYSLNYTSPTVSEGQTITITLNGTGLPDGTLVPFTISGTGISNLDFVGVSNLSGNFLIVNDKSQITLNVANDITTEGTESFILRLTGPGRTESIGITILDTSHTSGNVAQFYIKPDKVSIYEGQTVVFNVSAIDVPAGTVVPYTLSGIQNADVYNVPISGNLIFAANTVYDTAANVTLFLLQDGVTEGTENIVMLIYPSFSYTLQVSGTTQVFDSSTAASPKLYVTANKSIVMEGSNITFTVFGTNINAGTNVHYKIIPWTSWDQPNDLFPVSELTANAFLGLTSLNGNFPPLSQANANVTSNVSSVGFYLVDDYIFEPTRYFYMGVYTDSGLSTGSGIVTLLDSGNTYLRSFSTFTGNAEVKFLETANLTATVGGSTFREGDWIDTTGQISDDMVIQGKNEYAVAESAVYYQPFSYVIKSTRSIDEWITTIKEVLHPAGFTVFGEINNDTDPNNVNYAGIRTTENDTDISTYSTISIDNTVPSLKVGNLQVLINSVSTPLTVDLVTLQTNPQ